MKKQTSKNGNPAGSPSTRETLVQVATELFYEQGYPQTSIRQIGERLGITSSIIYHYFKNKEELLYEITWSVTNEFYRRLREVEREIEDPLAGLRAILNTHIKLFTVQHRKAAKIWAFDYYSLSPERQQGIRKANRRIYDLYRKRIDQLSKQGLLNDIDSTIVNFSISGAMYYILQWMKQDGRLSPDEIAGQVEKLFIYGLLKR
ncbi:MAG: TetR/AcrR family transcriptional regulator [Proteobacteria bacterium]|nr:TetR/AcrR family transcriptional regulator [Pseudomonadota bacterium]